MKLPIDDRFAEEAARFGLLRSCEDCALYDDRRDRCAHGFPTSEHRRSAEASGKVVFCKDFEAV